MSRAIQIQIIQQITKTMASKKSVTITSESGKSYGYAKIKRKVGMKRSDNGVWIPDYHQFYGATKKEAEQKYQAYMKEINKPVSTCFGDLLDSWIENNFMADSKYKDTTKQLYIKAFRNNFKDSVLLGKDISEITIPALQEEYNSLQCGASTVRSLHKLLCQFFKYADSLGYCQLPMSALVLPDVQHKKDDQAIDVLSDDEIEKIINGFKDHRLRLLIILALRTGARISELLALRYDDISKGGLKIDKQLYVADGGKYSIVPTKTGSSIRTIPLNDDTMCEIDIHKKWHLAEMMSKGYRTDYIFTTETGNFYHKSTIRKACDRVYRDNGVRSFGFHVYRHTFGSHLANRGVPIQTVSELLGHTNINTTKKFYVNVSSDAKKTAIASLGY